MAYAVMQKGPQAPTAEQLKTAYRSVSGIPAVDAARLTQDVFGVLARGLQGDQAAALQAALLAQGLPSEVADESSLPVLGPGKTLRRLEFTPEALMIFDPVGRKFPVEWAHIAVIAAASVQQPSFDRTRKERVEEKIKFHGLMPVKVRTVKVEYVSHESAEQTHRAEIVLTRGVARYTIESENFLYALTLGEKAQKNVSADFPLLLRELKAHAPLAALSRGASALLAQPPSTVSYPRHKLLEEEVVWMLWSAGR